MTGRRPQPSTPPLVRRFHVSPDEGGQRLDVLVRAHLADVAGPSLSNADVRRIIVGGGVRVDGRVLRAAGRPLAAGQRVEVLARRERLRSATTAEASPSALRILFEDDWLIAVDKPPGLPTVPTADPRRPSLSALVQAHLARGAPRETPAPPHVGVVQRLDVDTTGVVVFGKAPEATRALAQAFETRQALKTYRALTARPAGAVPTLGRLDASLEVRPRGRQGAVSAAAGGARAVTEARVVEVLERALLVEARPLTGRKHQVRAHLTDAGLPLLGDARYGGPASIGAVRAPRAMLHAWRLEIAHPVTGQRLVVEAPLPDDFRRALDGLRGAATGRHREG